MSDNCASKKSCKGRPRSFDREIALEQALSVFWQYGYQPASIDKLCQAMGIKPASLYATFGNKAKLFLEAVDFYEQKYWSKPVQNFMAEPDIYKAVENFFVEAATILLSPETPCGCMLVLAGVNISEEAAQIGETLLSYRLATKNRFQDRLRQAIYAGQIPPDSDVPAITAALSTFLEGLSIQARDGLFLSELKAMARFAVKLLPPKKA